MLLDMKYAPKDGTDVLLFPYFSGLRHPHFQCAMKGVVGCYNDLFGVWVLGDEGEFPSSEFSGWWPIGNAWLDPAAAPPPPRNQSFAGLVGTGVSGPAIVAWDIVRGEWYDHSTGSTVTLRGWLLLPGEDNA